MDIIFNAHPAIVFGIITFSTVLLFIAIWLLLKTFCSRVADKWPFFSRAIEKVRSKGNNILIQKYGLVGLAVVMALPFPTIGVYGGTILCWLTGMKWWSSLIAVVSGATVYNGIVILSAFGIIRVLGLSG